MVALSRSEVAAYFAVRLPDLPQRGEEWRAPCPIHQGKDRNFAVNADTGQSICHSQCGRGWDVLSFEQESTGVDFPAAKAEVFRIIGRAEENGSRRQVLRNPLKLAAAVRSTLEREGWQFASEGYFHGDLRQVRFEHTTKIQQGKTRPEKTFVWEHCVDGAWYSGTGGRTIPIYLNRPALENDQVESIVAVEGWAKADALGALGIPAASHKEINSENAAQFASMPRVYIWPDKDAAGAKMGARAAELLGKHNRNVILINPPAELPEGGDVIDAIALGWDANRILGLMKAAKSTRGIERIEDLPPVGESSEPIIYIREPEIAQGSVNGLTGDSGSGKSTLATAFVRDAIEKGVPCLILDRETPKPLAIDRKNRLGLADGPLLRWWGGWVGDVPGPSSQIVLDWVSACAVKPLIVVDSAIAFIEGNENDAAVMRGFMHSARRLADLGAAVIVIHHDGKADSARDFRGSSDFKAAVDQAFHVSNLSQDGKLDRLTLRCFKSRYGFTGSIIYHYADGFFVRDRRADAPAINSADQLTALLRQNPGIGTRQFEDEAAKQSIGRQRARDFLSNGVLSGVIRREDAGRNRFRHYLTEGS